MAAPHPAFIEHEDGSITSYSKKCSTCGVTKLLDEFGPRAACRDGRRSYCRKCNTASVQGLRKGRKEAGECTYFGCVSPAAFGLTQCAYHKDEHLARQKAIRTANPETHRKYMREAIQRNKSRTSAQIEADRLRLRPDGTKRCRRCREVRPLREFHQSAAMPDGLNYTCRGCVRQRTRQQHARRVASWAERGLYACSYCGAPAEETEHVVPLSAEDGPGDVDLNTVPSCAECNRGPGGKFDTPVDEWLQRLYDEGDPRGVDRSVYADWPLVVMHY